MTAVRAGADSLTITDTEGDRLRVDSIGTRSAGTYRVFVTIPGRQASVGITLEDGLALLSFVADALGVERAVAERTAPVVERARAVLALNATGSDAELVEALEALANALDDADSPDDEGRPT